MSYRTVTLDLGDVEDFGADAAIVLAYLVERVRIGRSRAEAGGRSPARVFVRTSQDRLAAGLPFTRQKTGRILRQLEKAGAIESKPTKDPTDSRREYALSTSREARTYRPQVVAADRSSKMNRGVFKNEQAISSKPLENSDLGADQNSTPPAEKTDPLLIEGNTLIKTSVRCV